MLYTQKGVWDQTRGVSPQGIFCHPYKNPDQKPLGRPLPCLFPARGDSFLPRSSISEPFPQLFGCRPTWKGTKPSSPPLAHPHPPPSGCPKAGTSRDGGPKPKGFFLEKGLPKTSRKEGPGSVSLCVPTTPRRLFGASACLWLHTAPGSCCRFRSRAAPSRPSPNHS